MPRDFRHYELPSRFAQRYRPVRAHAHEKGLAAFALDEYGLRFFRSMATGNSVPAQAIWSIVRNAANGTGMQLAIGRHDESLGYVVCEFPCDSSDPATYPVPRRLTYRAKVTIATLQALLHDLPNDPAGSAADVIGFIERRIDQLTI
jgi:hypothetical protein